jgi:NDP-sugar pyrophosphorylase family protein
VVRQAVIAGGGIGSRLSRGVNTLRSKQLIEYRGKTMIEHLIDGLKEGGVSEYLIGTAEHSHERINEIVRRLGIDVVCKVHKGAKFEMVPDHFSCDLDDRFLFVCGHQPISSEFVNKSRVAMKNAQYIIAKYQNEAYPHKKDRENYIYSGDEVRIVEFGQKYR